MTGPGLPGTRSRGPASSRFEPRVADRELQEPATPAPPHAPARQRGEALPTSYFQERLWVLDRLGTGNVLCNMTLVWTTRMPVDPREVAGAIAEIVARHEGLRATFHEGDLAPVVHLLPEDAISIARHDLAPLPELQRQRALREAADHALAQPFDLSLEPPVRFALYALAQGRVAVLITMHHIACDAQSMCVIARELQAACDRRPVPPPGLLYADYAARQRDPRNTAAMESDLRWWNDRLHGAPATSIFPRDRLVAADEPASGAVHEFTWSAALSEGVRSLAREERATVSTALLAACAAVLCRYTAQTDIVIGHSVSLREGPEFERIVGPFENLLPLRLDLSDDPPFKVLLARAHVAMREAHAHRAVPFERVLDHVKPPVSLEHAPLFQMALVQQPPLSANVECFRGVGALHEMAWSLRDDARGALSGRVEYRSDLHSAEAVQRIATHVRAVLSAAVDAPERRLGELPLLSPAERDQVIRAFNATSMQQDPATLPRRFERQVQLTPHATAMRFEDHSLTYEALDRRANQLARHLASIGVARGTRVALYLPRSLQLVVGLLGVLKAAAAYVPLDPDFPAERIAFMLEDSGATVVLTATRQPPPIRPAADVRLVDLLEEAPALEILDAGPLEVEPVAADPAYLIYTSGSTGFPKGVAVSHGALSNFLDAMLRAPGFSAQDVFAAITTISFDIAALELFLPLTVGARIELVPRAVASDGAALAHFLAESGATVLQGTPSTWRMLLEAGWPGSPRIRALCGGETLTRELAQRLLSRTGELWNLYGPTETTIWSTTDRVVSGSGPLAIGRPITNTSVYVLDDAGRPLPVGVPGELWIGGSGVAIGYHGRPEQTSQRFKPDPFTDRAGARMYRTGDLGRWLPDGRLEHLGRLDHQVKVRGFRIELGEIESTIARHPNVREAAVVARDDGTGGKELVAYVVWRGKPLPTSALHGFLRRSVPEYMLPTRIVALAALPLTANGKVDMKALPDPAAMLQPAGPVVSPLSVEPRGPVEVQLMAFWQQTLGSDALDVHDDFFEHGGHSLKAVQLLTRIQSVFGRRLPLSALFQAPTVASMAQLLAREQGPPSYRPLVAINPCGSALPMFWVPGVGGNVLVFGRLSRLLGPDQPFYGLQPRGLDGREPPFHSLDEMAAHYVSAVRAMQPQGPYIVCGTCTGGVVAYEMAQQLMQQGAAVRLVILEGWHPSTARQEEGWRLGIPWPLLFLGRKLADHARALVRQPVRRWPSLLRRAAGVAGRIQGMGVKSTLELSNYYSDKVVQATMKAVAAYELRPYPGWLLNVLASERAAEQPSLDRRRAWEHLADSAVAETVPSADSGQLFVSPHVEVVADILQRHVCNDSDSRSPEFRGR